MNRGAVRAEWEQFRDAVDAEATAAKSSQDALLQLSARYRSLDQQDRGVVDGLLTDWLMLDDEDRRFDAIALISEHRIASALPALRRLAAQLESAATPGAPYERAKVNRVIRRLVDA